MTYYAAAKIDAVKGLNTQRKHIRVLHDKYVVIKCPDAEYDVAIKVASGARSGVGLITLSRFQVTRPVVNSRRVALVRR